jgi:hypothetical protein
MVNDSAQAAVAEASATSRGQAVTDCGKSAREGTELRLGERAYARNMLKGVFDITTPSQLTIASSA